MSESDEVLIDRNWPREPPVALFGINTPLSPGRTPPDNATSDTPFKARLAEPPQNVDSVPAMSDLCVPAPLPSRSQRRPQPN